ncbi:MAG: 3-phosphoshikimate 1-carboxyvinyltransferase [Alphaproteobacteria bacterium]|nr:MAG: 3-phosphoshikimate 1-carboxyvinyltransferase [Alphaproteobacteria bacterium]
MLRPDRIEQARAEAFGPAAPLRGSVRVPGDKSISHRALMLSAMASGTSRIEGLLEGSDVLATAAALRAMGAGIERGSDGAWVVDGVGTGSLLQPESALDMGNSGTSARLLMGLLASHPISATITGDASLSRRPMERVMGPLRRIGAEFSASPGGRLPLTMRGISPAAPLEHRMTVASAQVKSAILLAGLNIAGVTRVFEPVPTRDHSERMLKRFGADLRVEQEAGGEWISIRGEAELRAQNVRVPADPSSAAFLAVAALVVPGSELRIKGVGMNPRRTGLFTLLRAMGADIDFADARDQDGEPVADLVVRHSALKGVEVPPELIPSMIDEFPIFFVAAAFADGETRAEGLGELRVKESDRIAVMAEGLRAIGGRIEEHGDGVTIRGSGGEPLAGGAGIASHLDHRIAMSFAVAGLNCREAVEVDDMEPVSTSFPGFAELLLSLQEGGR